MLNDIRIADELRKLAQVDIDATFAYKQALESLDDFSLKAQLQESLIDHEAHMGQLAVLLKEYGSAPLSTARDLRGFLIEGFTALRSATGIEGSLKAMRLTEMLTNRCYEDALKMEFPERIQNMLFGHFCDEKRHLILIERALENKPWLKDHEGPPSVSVSQDSIVPNAS